MANNKQARRGGIFSNDALSPPPKQEENRQQTVRESAETASMKKAQKKQKKPFLTETEIKKRKAKRTRVAAASFVLLLGIGILGNWYLDNAKIAETVQPLISAGKRVKTLGEAELVDAPTEVEDKENTYFSSARVERQNARDEALNQLSAVLEKTDEKEAARKKAAEKMAQLSENITNENKIETLVIAKGVEHCLAVIGENGDRVDVIVDAEELSDTLIMQIKDIAMSQTGCSFEAVSIIQSK